jgi:hypothetical protein
MICMRHQIFVSVKDVIYAPESKDFLSITSHIQTEYHKTCQVICQYILESMLVSHMMMEKQNTF